MLTGTSLNNEIVELSWRRAWKIAGRGWTALKTTGFETSHMQCSLLPQLFHFIKQFFPSVQHSSLTDETANIWGQISECILVKVPVSDSYCCCDR